jgi:CheY-like chemotaxis protein
VVDDEQHAREYTAIVLDRIGLKYDIASSGKEAISKVVAAQEKGRGYDICFIDWKMSDMSGIEVTKRIRAIYDKDTIIVIISAYDLSEVQDEAIAAGANQFISKPLFQSTVFNLLLQLSGGNFVRATADSEDFDFTGHRILLAEDNALNAEIAMELLNMVHMQADRVENGKTAVEMFVGSAEGTYDAILMDIQMPVMNGYEAAQAIRASDHPQAKTIPIYAMTANAFTEDVSAALSAGMNGHIAKPIDTEVLYSTLKKAVANYEHKK